MIKLTNTTEQTVATGAALTFACEHQLLYVPSERHRKCKTESQRRLYGLVPCECDRGYCSNTCTARFGSGRGCHAGNDYDIYP